MSLLKKYFALLIVGGVVWPLGGVQATEGTQLQLPDFQPQQISPQPPRSVPVPLEVQTRGLYDLFKDEYKFLFPLNPRMALINMLPNMRFHGRYGLQREKYLCHYQITHPAPEHQPTSDVDCPQDHTSALVQHFFPSPAGGILRTPALESIDLIGRMDMAMTGKLLKLYVDYTTQMSTSLTEEGKQKVEKEFSPQFEAFFKGLLESLNKNKKGDENTSGYTLLEKAWGQSLETLPGLYATMLIETFKERSFYPAHVVEYTLLAYAWKKAKNRDSFLTLIKNELKDFLIPIEKKEKVFSPDGKVIKDKITPFSEELYWEQRKKGLENNQLIPEVFEEWLKDPELLTFMTLGYHLFENPYPKMLDFSTAVYTPPSSNKGIPFSDCGEMSVRNFFNFMIANPSTKGFDVEVLTKAFPHIRKEVVTFYQKFQPFYRDVVGGKDRDAWANSISGLNPEKVSYLYKVCNINGSGIDNILAVLEEILGDEKLKQIHDQDKERERAKKFNHILEKFNNQRQGDPISWSGEGQSEKLSAFPVITLKVGNTPVFDWTFMKGHFTFLPMVDRKASTNWLYNSTTGFDTILNSSLSDDLKRVLLPFYKRDLTTEAHKEKLKGYGVDLLFGSPLDGRQRLLESLDVLTLNKQDPSLKGLAANLIKKFFAVEDETGDRMLVAFLFQHKDVFGDITAEAFGDRLATVYKETLVRLKLQAFLADTENFGKFFEKLLGTPFASDLALHTVMHLPRKLLGRSKFEHGSSILHLSCKKNALPIVKMLLGDPVLRNIFLNEENIRNSSGFTPLYYACYEKNTEMIKVLLHYEEARKILLKGENIKDRDGYTPLHLACFYGNLEVVKVLLEDEEVRKILLGGECIRNRQGYTPLHLACIYGNLEMVKVLLEGESARKILLDKENIADGEGRTPLHAACIGYHLEIVKILLEDEYVRKILLDEENIKDGNGSTPLDLAQSDEIKKLLKTYGL